MLPTRPSLSPLWLLSYEALGAPGHSGCGSWAHPLPEPLTFSQAVSLDGYGPGTVSTDLSTVAELWVRSQEEVAT